MSTFAGRLNAIKMKVGGSRNKPRWEQMTGAPPEEQFSYTGPNAQNRRILAEIGFALTLPGTDKDKPAIGSALQILEKALEAQGVINNEQCRTAEEALLPLEKAAKEYTVLFASHAHIDMNWMWGWQETVQSALASFRTVLGLMNEYPAFTYSQSQASCYHLVEKFDPEMMKDIKKRIEEGRWEVTASAWVETDKNMPCTESLLRHIAYTKNYMKSVWGVDPAALNIDFSPDTFGHSANIPEIDTYGNVKYMYHCRGLVERRILYRWRGLSGAEIIVHSEPNWYNRGIQDEIALGAVETASLCGGLKTSLIVYGCGDHGGGPTRRDIEHIIEMQKWPVYPELRFGTFGEYFKAAETVRDKLSLHDKEVNFLATGCYTTQSRIKLGNRRTEAALLDAEFLDSMSAVLTGKKYPAARLERSWQKTLFNHFHDILTGSCVRDSRESAMGYFADAQAAAGTARETAGIAIAENIDTSGFTSPADQAEIYSESRSEGAGTGFGLENYGGIPSPERGRGNLRLFHIFNPGGVKRHDVTEITLWDWNYDFKRMEIVDHTGKAVPFQIFDREPKHYWDHHYTRIFVRTEIPAGGYTTLALREKEFGETYPVFFHPYPRTDHIHNPVILENEFIRAEFDPSGTLLSLKDKKTNKEKIAAGKSAGLVIKWAEKRSNNAWQTGRYLGEKTRFKNIKLTPYTGNELRNGFELEQEVLGSKITARIYLDAGSKALSFEYKIDWNEAGKDHKNIPVLCFALPLETTPESFQTDIPAGVYRRQSAYHDIPGLQYAAAINGKEAVAIITDCKYGYRGCGNDLYATLINSAVSPDPYPERGEHEIKLWVTLDESDPKTIYHQAFERCHPPSIISGTKHTGKLPPSKELLRIDSASTVMSSSGVTSDGDLLIRLYETNGSKDNVTISLPLEIAGANFVDLDGKNQNSDALSVKGNTLSLTMSPYTIRGIKIKFKG